MKLSVIPCAKWTLFSVMLGIYNDILLLYHIIADKIKARTDCLAFQLANCLCHVTTVHIDKISIHQTIVD